MFKLRLFLFSFLLSFSINNFAQDIIHPIPIEQVSEGEILDLSEPFNDEDPSPPVPSCQIFLPSGALVGITSGALLSSTQSSCWMRQQAQSQYPLAQEIHRQLWCTDPLGYKRTYTDRVIRDKQQYMDAYLAREEAKKQFSSPQTQSERMEFPKLYRFFSSVSWLSPLTRMIPQKSQKTTSSPLPELPYYDATQEKQLEWNHTEKLFCQNPDPLTGPALAVVASGSIQTPTQRCEAMVIESTFLTGRYAPSKIQWIFAPSCPGYHSPSPDELSTLVVQGKSIEQRWIDQHLRDWHWAGSPVRRILH